MMEKFGEFVKRSVINFKLELCCFVASVRTGALTLAFINVILGLIVLVTLADPPKNDEGEEDGFEPLLLQAFKSLADEGEDAPNFKPSCVLAYVAEIASNALVICAMWRNDLVLLRAYLYYALGVLTAAVMVYSVVIGALNILSELLIVASLGTQLYQIMLVRSAMVEIKQASVKNGFTVNLRPNDSEGGPGPNDKFTVTIEPEKLKRPLVIPVSKEDISKPVLNKELSKEGSVKEAPVTVHSPAKEAFLRDKEAKPAKEEIAKPSRVFGKEKAKIGDTNVKIHKVDNTKKL